MPKKVMRRRASDNIYLHKDFHGTLSLGLEYLEEKYGAEAVREYLRTFACSYYEPLKEKIQAKGLLVLKERIEKIYQEEGGKVEISFSEEEMVVTVHICPAVTHIKSRNYRVAHLFSETEATVNEAICEGTPFVAELLWYDKESGSSKTRYVRRKK